MSNKESRERHPSSRLDEANYEYFWGCELTRDKATVTWSFEEEEGDTDFLTHTLFLKHAVLGAGAVKGERNLVEFETENFGRETVKQPVFSLTLGQHDHCSLDVSFGHLIPVTFKLIEGTGPVFIAGQHLVEFPTEPQLGDDTQDDLYVTGEINTEDEEEDSPLKQAKKRKAGAQKAAKAKKGKLDDSMGDDGSDEESMDEDDEDDDELDEDEDDDDEDDEEDSPPKKSKAKGKKNGKAKASDAKSKPATKRPAKAANGKAPAKKAKKAKA